SGSNTLVSSEGGFLLTPQIAAEIKSAMYETGQLYKAADIMPLGGSNDRYVWVEAVNEDRSTAGSYNGIVAYRVNEGVAATTSKPQFRERELAVKDMMVRVPVTRQLLGDAVALQRMIMNDAPKAMNKKVDREIIQGTGSGQCLGIINASSTVSVAKENLQPADTIVKENIDKMFDIFDPDYLTGAAWHVNPFARKELRNLVMAVGTGGAPVYLPEGGMSGTPYATLLGLPVIPTNACPKLGDKGDIILANMNEYLMVEKGGIEAAESMHVLFNTNEHMFRFTWRINGMPKLAQQITPENANAGDRLSSFVTLDARA
ncbi:MAG: phage major capsid protein, partial [Nitrosopumilus sp.]|nr:phage major capsid protein [Nitrosopumilus sp.]